MMTTYFLKKEKVKYGEEIKKTEKCESKERQRQRDRESESKNGKK